MIKIPAHLAPFEQFFTRHALERLCQRRIPVEGVLAALEWGQPTKQPGGLWRYFLGSRQARRAAAQGVDLSSFVGLNVIDSGERIVTAYWGGR